MSLILDLRPSFLFLFFFFSFALHIKFSHGLGIQFVTPKAGGTYPAGPLAVSWEDAGGIVSLADLVTYNLYLMVGGNSPSNSKALMTLNPQPNAPIKDLSLAATIPANIGQSIQNGFYLQMVSNTSTGNQTINYSNRFTLIELNGTTDALYVQGAASSVGDSNVPTPQFNSYPLPPAAPTTTSSSQPTSTAPITPETSDGPDGDGGSASRFSVSGGALVGLTVGTICAVILLLLLGVLGFFWWRGRRLRQRQQNQNKSLEEPPEAGSWPDKVELAAQSPPATRGIAPIAELSHEQSAVSEAMSPIPAVEADSEVRYELEGDWTGWEAAARRSRVASYDPLR